MTIIRPPNRYTNKYSVMNVIIKSDRNKGPSLATLSNDLLNVYDVYTRKILPVRLHVYTQRANTNLASK